jgi:hypothetical protein
MWRTSVTSLSSAACQLARLHCTAPHSYLAGGPARLFTSSADATPVGGYTPITQQLWLERFNVINSTSQEGSSGNTSSKELTYRFSSDHILREQYRSVLGALGKVWLCAERSCPMRSCPQHAAHRAAGCTCSSCIIAGMLWVLMLCFCSHRNPWGRIRIGRIMEDLDSLAGQGTVCSQLAQTSCLAGELHSQDREH